MQGPLMSLPEMSLPESSADAAAPACSSRAKRSPRIWKFIGTSLWGLLAFGAMFAGQITVAAWFLMTSDGPVDFATAKALLCDGVMISLSVGMGLPAGLWVLGVAKRIARAAIGD